jgi:hypothetical protein
LERLSALFDEALILIQSQIKNRKSKILRGGESRGGKKIRWPKGRAGSSPALGIKSFCGSPRN